MSRTIRKVPKPLCIVGAGAVVEEFYLPALTGLLETMADVVLFDLDPARCQELAKKFGCSVGQGKYADAIGTFGLAIVTTPPSTHARIATDFLKAGVPVAVEKPFTQTAQEATDLIALSKETKTGIIINQTRRFFPVSRHIRESIASGKLGTLKSVSYHEGGPFAWPSVSGFYFRSDGPARGVLADRGSHVLDLLCWWLGERLEVLSCEDDSQGGPEGYSKVSAKTASGIEVKVGLSWHGKLANEIVITGDKATLSTGVYDYFSAGTTSPAGVEKWSAKSDGQGFIGFVQTYLADAMSMAFDGAPPAVSAESVQPSIQLLEDAYNQRQRIPSKWFEYEYV